MKRSRLFILLVMISSLLSAERSAFHLDGVKKSGKNGSIDRSETAILIEDFENCEPDPDEPCGLKLPEGWSRINGGEEEFKWFTHPGGYMSPVGHDGPHAAVITWGTPNDDYLITPRLSIRENEELSFWSRKLGNEPESFEVLVSKGEPTANSFSIIMDSIIIESGGWVKYNYLLTEHPELSSGDQIYIAFRNTSDFKFGQTIDDIMVDYQLTEPTFTIDYDYMDFGDIPVDVTVDYGDLFRITNSGAGTLEITIGTDLSSTEFTTNLPQNVSLGAQEYIEFGFTYTPIDTNEDHIELELITNAVNDTITLKGSGYNIPEGVIQVGYEKWVGAGIPFSPNYRYSYSQSLFHKSEIELDGVDEYTIDKISYHFNGEGSFSKDIELYIKHTELNELSPIEWVDPYSFTKVYEGELVIDGEEGWVDIELEEPFLYNNDDNLLLAIRENSSQYYLNGESFYSTEVDSEYLHRSNCAYFDAYPIEFDNMPFAEPRPDLPNIRITYDPESNIDETTPISFQLEQNYPNPFNPTTSITFSLTKSCAVNLTIFNSSGELVENIVDKEVENGSHTITFNGSNLNSGVYFYKLTVDGITDTKKMILVK